MHVLINKPNITILLVKVSVPVRISALTAFLPQVILLSAVKSVLVGITIPS